jgi:hypothetical protein
VAHYCANRGADRMISRQHLKSRFPFPFVMKTSLPRSAAYGQQPHHTAAANILRSFQAIARQHLRT